MIRALLIGGSHAGERVYISRFAQSIRFPVPQKLEFNAITSDDSYPEPMKIEEYLFLSRTFDGLYIYKVIEAPHD